jgi:hypothetical protein
MNLNHRKESLNSTRRTIFSDFYWLSIRLAICIICSIVERQQRKNMNLNHRRRIAEFDQVDDFLRKSNVSSVACNWHYLHKCLTRAVEKHESQPSERIAEFEKKDDFPRFLLIITSPRNMHFLQYCRIAAAENMNLTNRRRMAELDQVYDFPRTWRNRGTART